MNYEEFIQQEIEGVTQEELAGIALKIQEVADMAGIPFEESLQFALDTLHYPERPL